MKALPNNNKPATHFIEAIGPSDKYPKLMPYYNYGPFPIALLYNVIRFTAQLNTVKTIAIFKIRSK